MPTRKTEDFEYKSRKTDLKNDQSPGTKAGKPIACVAGGFVGIRRSRENERRSRESNPSHSPRGFAARFRGSAAQTPTKPSATQARKQKNSMHPSPSVTTIHALVCSLRGSRDNSLLLKLNELFHFMISFRLLFRFFAVSTYTMMC